MEDEDLIDFDEARPAGLHSLRLPAFWVDKPVSWFVLAESRFRLHGIHREQTRYDYLVSALFYSINFWFSKRILQYLSALQVCYGPQWKTIS